MLSSIPGLYSLSGSPTPATPYGVYVPATIPGDLAPQYVHVGGTTVQVSSEPTQTGELSASNRSWDDYEQTERDWGGHQGRAVRRGRRSAVR